MEVRGDRRCKDCGARWSYYETNSVACPECGSLLSVGVEEQRRLHTDAAVELDLAEARTAAAERTPREAAAVAAEAATRYVRKRGFVSGGDLRVLDERYLAAAELRHAAGMLERRRAVDDDEEAYLLALLADAPDGERPAPGDVPASLRAARGLAVAEAVREFRDDAADWLDRQGSDPPGRSALERLEEHARRLDALDGEVSPVEADRLAAAAREVGKYLREGDEAALESARARLDRLDGAD